MINFTKELPEDCVLSEDMRKRAKCFFSVQFFGVIYWIPVTIAVKRAFGISERKGKFHIGIKEELLLDDFARDIVASVYFEVRETLAGRVEETLRQNISEQFQNLFSKQLGTAVRNGMQQRAIAQSPDVVEPK